MTKQELNAENDRLADKVVALAKELAQEQAKVRALHNLLRRALPYIPNEGDQDMDLREDIQDVLNP